MQEKLDKMYKEYLSKRLDAIITIPTNETVKRQFNLPVDIVKNKINGVKYDAIDHIGDNYAVVRDHGLMNFVNQDGDLISEVWLSTVSDFSEGYARVKLGGFNYFIDMNGNPLKTDQYIELRDFHEGFAAVKRQSDGLWNFIDKTGKPINNKWFTSVQDFSEGYAVVYTSYNDKVNIMNTKGKLLFKKWKFGEIGNFHNGLATIELQTGSPKMNIIRKNGKILFKDNSLSIHYNYPYTKIDTYDYSIFKTDAKDKSTFKIYRTDDCTIIFDEYGLKFHVVYLNKDLKDYQLSKKTIGYELKNDKETINLKYEPIKVLNSNYILCASYIGDVYLYNKDTATYKEIGKYGKIAYGDNIIIGNDVYLVYGKNIYDITDYYNKKLKNKKKFIVKEGHSLQTKEDFFALNEEEIKSLVEKEAREDQIKEEEETQKRELLELEELTKNREIEEKKKEQDQIKALKELKKVLDRIDKYNVKKNDLVRRRVNSLFVVVGDHKEINPKLLEEPRILRHIDFSMESLDNVKLSGLDLHDCNIPLNPQEVYNKDLSGCNLEGIHITPFMNFSGVDIRGARFSDDDNSLTQDFGNGTFELAIYDGTTTYNGIPFNIIYGECQNTVNNRK